MSTLQQRLAAYANNVDRRKRARPITVLADDFTRADANLEANANWQRVSGVAGALAVSSNRLASTSTTQSTYLIADALPVSRQDHFVEADWNGGSNTGWLIARYADENNYVGVQVLALVPTLYTRIGGTFTVIGAGGAHVAGNRLRIECRRQQIRLLQNGLVVAAVVLPDNVLATGKVGLQARSTTAANMADNFAAGTLRA